MYLRQWVAGLGCTRNSGSRWKHGSCEAVGESTLHCLAEPWHGEPTVCYGVKETKTNLFSPLYDFCRVSFFSSRLFHALKAHLTSTSSWCIWCSFPIPCTLTWISVRVWMSGLGSSFPPHTRPLPNSVVYNQKAFIKLATISHFNSRTTEDLQ